MQDESWESMPQVQKGLASAGWLILKYPESWMKSGSQCDLRGCRLMTSVAVY